MKKSIEIIIKQKNKDPLRRIKKVSLGYALNYLIPKNIADISTKRKIRHIQVINTALSKKKNETSYRDHQIKLELEQIKKLQIRKKYSPNKQIFGSVTETDITSKIFMITGQKFDKKQISIKNIKEIGLYKCEITISNSSTSNILISVLPYTL